MGIVSTLVGWVFRDDEKEAYECHNCGSGFRRQRQECPDCGGYRIERTDW